MKFSAIFSLSLVGLGNVCNAQTIAEVAETNGFSTLLAAAQATGQDAALAGDEPLTVFAPTDDAFAALPAGVVDRLLEEANVDALTKIIGYHVLSGTVQSGDLMDGMEPETLAGETLAVTLDPPAVNGVEITMADIPASNGVVHVIGQVLVPPSMDLSSLIAGAPGLGEGVVDGDVADNVGDTVDDVADDVGGIVDDVGDVVDSAASVKTVSAFLIFAMATIATLM